MKKHLALSAVLIFGAISSYGSQSRTGYQSQFHVPHVKKQIQAHSQQAEVSKSGTLSPTAHHTPGSLPIGQTRAHVAHLSAHTNSPATLGFVSATQVTAGGATRYQPFVGDFNGDGKKDVVALVESYNNCNTGATGNTASYCVSVVLSNGDGTFQAPVLTSVSSNDPILVGDLNGDGKDDLIQAHPGNTPSTVDVWMSDSDGDGKFVLLANSPTVSPVPLQGGILTDVNGDGKLDLLAVDSQAPGLVWTLLGNGNGTFQAATSVALAGSAPGNIIFGDFNGDGKPDFAGLAQNPSNNNNYQVNIYLGSAGNFTLTGLPLTTSDNIYDSCNLTAGDLNGDGKAEIVSTNCNDNNLTVYVSNGDGTFQTGVYYAAAAPSTGNSNPDLYPYSATIADVNGDGKNDVIVSNWDSGDITILLGKGDGTVTAPNVGYAAGGYGHQPAIVADFNRDGLADIIVANDEYTFAYLQGYGDGTFRAALDYYIPSTGTSWPESVTIASGDFNGDGIADFAVGNCCDSTVGITVFLSRGDGSLQPGVNYGLGGGLENVAVADFDGDGKLDIAAADSNNGDVQIFKGQGDGTFVVASTTYPTDSVNGNPWGIVTGDFNHDQHIDIAVVNQSNDDVGVLLNDGTGGFLTPVNYALSTYVYSLAAGDINGDGYTDLLVPLWNGSGIAVLLANNDNSGTFQPGTTLSLVNGTSTYSNPGYITLGDINGDGKLDLAVSIDDYTTYNQGIAVALGNGDGTFQTPVFYPATTQTYFPNVDVPWPSFVQFADINGDGKQDLVYTNEDFGTVGVLFGDGAGNFGTPNEYIAGSDVYGLTIADVNGDGAVDVVTADYDSAAVTVLLNNNGSATKADYSVAADTNTATVAAGSPATYNLSLTGKNGYNGTVTFSCSGLPAKASCAFSPASVVANGNLPQSTALTITTTAATAYFVQPVRPNSKPSAPTFWASLSGLGVFGLVLAGDGKKRNRRQMAIVLGILLLVMMFTLVGCGGGSSSGGNGGGGGGGTPGTPAGSYAVTVTATGTGSNAPTHTMNLTLIVQ